MSLAEVNFDEHAILSVDAELTKCRGPAGVLVSEETGVISRSDLPRSSACRSFLLVARSLAGLSTDSTQPRGKDALPSDRICKMRRERGRGGTRAKRSRTDARLEARLAALERLLDGLLDRHVAVRALDEVERTAAHLVALLGREAEESEERRCDVVALRAETVLDQLLRALETKTKCKGRGDAP